ncbi:MAG: hypothetical protein GY903_12655 [Fuerstiella sp.]|nr:hypothetical protein [Fuerstiella sp.]MCP4855334.1 hypothetical protein [Fuerstiella sp.]
MTKPETVEGEECDDITVGQAQIPTLTRRISRKTGVIKKTNYAARDAEPGYVEAVEDVKSLHRRNA